MFILSNIAKQIPCYIAALPENLMPETQGLIPAQMRVSYVCLAIGAMTLAFGIHMGFTKDSGSIVAIVLLGSVVLFAVALWPLLKLYKFPIFKFGKTAPAAAKTEPQPEAEVQPEAKGEVQAGTKNEIQPEVKTGAQPEDEVEVQPEAEGEAQPGIKAGAETQPEIKAEAISPAKAESRSKIDAKTDVAKLMNTTLGELLLAALIKDPEAAGRFVAQAISRAEGA